jgi:hypothetical protein
MFINLSSVSDYQRKRVEYSFDPICVCGDFRFYVRPPAYADGTRRAWTMFSWIPACQLLAIPANV